MKTYIVPSLTHQSSQNPRTDSSSVAWGFFCLVGVILPVSTKRPTILPWLGYLYLIGTLSVLWAHHEKETEKKRKARSEHLVDRELTLSLGKKYEKKKILEPKKQRKEKGKMKAQNFLKQSMIQFLNCLKREIGLSVDFNDNIDNWAIAKW